MNKVKNRTQIKLFKQAFSAFFIGLIILSLLIIIFWRANWLNALPVLLRILFLGGVLILLSLSILGAFRFLDILAEKKALEARLEQANNQTQRAYRRMEAIFRISHKYVEAGEEIDIINLVIRLVVDFLGAIGVSYVPLDDRGQPLASLNYGELPTPVMDAWVEYLATPAVRDRCTNCDKHATFTSTCPLLDQPITKEIPSMATVGMYCLPLRSGEKEFGVLNLYLSKEEMPDSDAKAFLRAMINQAALAIDGIRLRRHEIQLMRQFTGIHQHQELEAILRTLLSSAQQALEADFVALRVSGEGSLGRTISLTPLQLNQENNPFIEGAFQAVENSRQPVMMGNMANETKTEEKLKSILTVPLISYEQVVIGAILVGSISRANYNQRHLTLLQTLASQAVMAIQHSNLSADVEYKAIVQERARLAREIHDGLAQTLGFLKLQAAQMRNQLNPGQSDRFKSSLELYYNTLSQAYEDIREIIDGLRVDTDGAGFDDWLRLLASEFMETSGLSVILEDNSSVINIPAEVQLQLIRIVQEALSNVRKHSNANEVRISYSQVGSDLYFEIRDDGIGFSPEDVISPTRHGLRGMRERAELINADFQIISRISEGTTIRLHLPMSDIHEGVVR